ERATSKSAAWERSLSTSTFLFRSRDTTAPEMAESRSDGSEKWFQYSGKSQDEYMEFFAKFIAVLAVKDLAYIANGLKEAPTTEDRLAALRASTRRTSLDPRRRQVAASASPVSPLLGLPSVAAPTATPGPHFVGTATSSASVRIPPRDQLVFELEAAEDALQDALEQRAERIRVEEAAAAESKDEPAP
ncbi:unnamed protein product, partial [Phaeothamnion confervicola]